VRDRVSRDLRDVGWNMPVRSVSLYHRWYDVVHEWAPSGTFVLW
jgi:hypothetical protein